MNDFELTYLVHQDGSPVKPLRDEERPRYPDPTCNHLIRCWGSQKCAACGWEPA